LRSAPVPLLTDTGELPSEPVHFENLQPLRSTFDALLERFYEESASSKRKGGGLSSLLSKDKTLNGRFSVRLSALGVREQGVAVARAAQATARCARRRRRLRLCARCSRLRRSCRSSTSSCTT
jgi:hypothetical protein